MTHLVVVVCGCPVDKTHARRGETFVAVVLGASGHVEQQLEVRVQLVDVVLTWQGKTSVGHMRDVNFNGRKMVALGDVNFNGRKIVALGDFNLAG